MKTAREWKTFYARERERLGAAGLEACLDRADALGLPGRLRGADAVVFPHTRLETSGELAAAAALAAVRSGSGTVLALGVLHGARVEDAALVRDARAGDERARAVLRRVHGPGAPDDAGRWEEEFSLDGFCALLAAAARREGRPPPRVVRRFPFLTGDGPADLPGLDELRALLAAPEGVFLAATADPVHHGLGYDTPVSELRPRDAPATADWALACVREGFQRLAAGDFLGFLSHAAGAKSDFRDPGPVMVHLLGAGLCVNFHGLRLVDYADVLAAPAPTWVAGALAAFSAPAGASCFGPMKNFVLLAACCGGLAAPLPAAAQTSAPTPNTAYPDSPARANPRPGTGRRPAGPDDGARGPRGPLDWERTEALSPNGELFVTANLDDRVRVWETVTGRSAVELPTGTIEAVFSPDSRLIAARAEKPVDGPGGRSWQVFAAADGRPAGQPLVNPDPDDGAEVVVFSPDGKWLAGFVGTGANVRVALWDAAGGKPAAVQPVKELSGGSVLAFSPDGKTLAAVGAGTGVALFGVPDLKPLRVIPFEQRTFLTAAFSPDGRLLAAGGDEQRTVRGQREGYPTASLYEAATGKLVAELKVAPNPGARVRQVIFADGGRALVTATDGTAQAWSPADGRLQANLPGGGFPLAVSPDGKLLAGTQFPGLRCWDTAAWRLTLKIDNAGVGYGVRTGHFVYLPLAFIPDGSGVVTMRGNSVAAWELPGGRPVIERDATQARAAH